MRRFIPFCLFGIMSFLIACTTDTESTNNGIVEPGTTTPPPPSMIDTQTVDSAGVSKRMAIDVPQPVEAWDLRAEMSRAEFNEKKGAELEMLLIRPIYSKIFDLDDVDSLVIPHLTSGQKALYFFRKMDEAMSEGGLESLQSSQIIHQLPVAAQAFNQVNIGKLGVLAEKAAIDHKVKNSIPNPNRKIEIDPFMKGFDNEYSKYHNDFYSKLESYIREHPEEFVKFTD